MIELAPVAIGTVHVAVKVDALLGLVVGVNVVLLQQLVVSVGKGAFGPIFALTHLPVPADLRFELLLEV